MSLQIPTTAFAELISDDLLYAKALKCNKTQDLLLPLKTKSTEDCTNYNILKHVSCKLYLENTEEFH